MSGNEGQREDERSGISIGALSGGAVASGPRARATNASFQLVAAPPDLRAAVFGGVPGAMAVVESIARLTTG